MAFELVSTNPFWRFPNLWEEDEDLLPSTTNVSGLTVSEDDKNVFVEAAIPGLEPKDIDVTFDKGVLSVRGQKQEEEKKRKYYRKASTSFSYRVLIPQEVDQGKEPLAEAKNGIMYVTFAKVPATEPKKIPVKARA